MPDAAIDTLHGALHPLTGEAPDYDALLELVGDARIVLLGEATHGSHEFYGERARITRRLIEEKAFTTIAIEADWPDAYRVNRFVRGSDDDGDADAALSGFRRFPVWMWRNSDTVRLVDWLRRWNAHARTPVGFYGIDLYSMFASIQAVLRYLDDVDPDGARRARYRYSCFDQFGEDSQAYGYAAEFGLARPCEDDAVAQLVELQRRAADLASRDGRIPEDEFFFAEQNARLVRNAEEYYRTMFDRRTSSWNLRDRHMTDTIAALVDHFDRRHGTTRVIVWAHNSHIGDARATEMHERGELNVGRLARERWGNDVRLIGFTTYSGGVTAASDWGEPAVRKRIRPALPDSWESLFHELGTPRFLLPLRGADHVRRALPDERLERAIGVIYRPESERVSHYFRADLSRQFDAVIHIDETTPLEPLEPGEGWHAGEEAPETYPFAV
jgi:erythromycin esterase-like protein